MRHLLRKAALRQLRCAATGEAPQHTLRVGQQLRRHAVCEARVALGGAVGTPGSARVARSVLREFARDADSSKRVWRLADMSITNMLFYVFSTTVVREGLAVVGVCRSDSWVSSRG